MPILKPFKRISREMISGNMEYLDDSLYSNDRLSYIHSYHLVEKDLKKLFDYISPNTLNNTTFSHRIYDFFFSLLYRI